MENEMNNILLLAIAFTLSLIIPFLINPVNALYDIGELENLRAYCYLHADRAAKGENVVNDLIKTGLANSTFQDWGCLKISQTLEAEQKAEAERQQRLAVFAERCRNDEVIDTEWDNCVLDAGVVPPSQSSFYSCVKSGEGTEEECHEKWAKPKDGNQKNMNENK
jgi:hypothetical protein